MDSEVHARPQTVESEDLGFEWAIVEIMGHRSHAGRIREEERFGAKFIRIDEPIDGDRARGWRTHIYSAAAIFSLRLSDEASVMEANTPYASPYRITARTKTASETGAADEAGDISEDERF